MIAAPRSLKKGFRRGCVALLALTALVFAGSRPATALSFSDDFSGSVLMPLWETYLPKKGATAQISASHALEIETSKTGVYDHWTNVDQAPQVRMDAPDGDFTIQTRLSLPDSPNGSFHAGLFVMFGKNDLCLWGPYQSETTIKMERSGTGYSLRSVSYSPIDLRIRKVGTAYHFEYKAVSGANWVSAQTITAKDPPIKVGLMAKTWASLDVKADFLNFALYGDGFRIDLTNQGWIRATIADGTNLANGPWLIVRDPSGKQIGGVAKAAANGRATVFNVPAGTYSVKSVHPHFDSSETETVAVTAGQETAVNLTVVPCPNWDLKHGSKDLQAAGATAGWSLLPGQEGSSGVNKIKYYLDPTTDSYAPTGQDATIGVSWMANVRMPGDYGPRTIPDDSIFWYRLDLNLPDADSRFVNRQWLLSGFNVDDEDVTYFNGQNIGQTRSKTVSNSWMAIRSYLIASGSVKAPGHNVIAIQGYEGGGGAGVTQTEPILQAEPDSGGDLTISLTDRWGDPAVGVTVTLTSLGGAYQTQAVSTKDGAFFRWLPEGAYQVTYDRAVGIDPALPRSIETKAGDALTVSLVAPTLPFLDLTSDALEAAGSAGWLFMPTPASLASQASADDAPAQPDYPDSAEDATYGQDWFAGTPVPADLGWDSPKDKTKPIEDDSYFWYRLHLVVPADWKDKTPGRDLLLAQFQVDDSDLTFFNGKLVGQTNDAEKIRSYVIPRASVKWGEDNVIAIRGHQAQGGAGIVGDDPFSLTINPKATAGNAPGDANGDGVVNPADAMLALKAALGLIDLTPDQLSGADLNGDGEVEIAEATKILQAAVGLIQL